MIGAKLLIIKKNKIIILNVILSETYVDYKYKTKLLSKCDFK